MGFLSGLFSSQSDYERQLEETHTRMFQALMRISVSEARRTARDMIHDAKEELKRSEEAHLPQDYGDQLLQRELTDPSVKEQLAKKRQEGVTDADIRWWWNLPAIERVLMEKVDGLQRYVICLKESGDSQTPEHAAAALRKLHPMYGDPADTSQTTGDDRPLPYELRNRVNAYIQKRLQNDPLIYKKDIASSSTFNALVRRGIRSGQI
ncbi:MAG: hypothetical protein KGL31_00945 [candidate division NC10 bacterium]|nr:hypothetical protein [candidate division NC10 bacterium]MDE2320478.1 hypothetical protein [candidate division NC10 bacterium]